MSERLQERLRQLRATTSPRVRADSDQQSQNNMSVNVNPHNNILGGFSFSTAPLGNNNMTNSPSVRDLFNQKREGIRQREASMGRSPGPNHTVDHADGYQSVNQSVNVSVNQKNSMSMNQSNLSQGPG